MPSRTAPRRSIGPAAVVLALAAGCMPEQPRPSLVEGLRVLGLRADPAVAAPGEPIALELLWADPEPPCSAATPCGPGRRCVEDRCVRQGPTEIAWLVLSLGAFEAMDDLDPGLIVGDRCLLDRCPPPMPCELDADCPGEGGRCAEGRCVPCFAFGPATFCCGSSELAAIETLVPLGAGGPPRDCSDPGTLDLARLLRVQVQLCAGGEIDLCPAAGSTSFGCAGEGAETVVATSLVPVDPAPEWPNAPPEVTALLLSGAAWPEGEPLEVGGCLEEGCADRRCDEAGTCAGGRTCSDGLCLEEIEVSLGPTAVERYLEPCDEPAPCEADPSCGDGLVCEGGRCLRVESPLVSFFATAGTFTLGRAQLDLDGDGRPDSDRARTRWRPPVLEPCVSAGDPCSFGRCDPGVGRCVGEASFWAVVRDGRGGQGWVERTLRLAP